MWGGIAWISTLSLTANYSIAEETAGTLNADVYYAVSENVSNPLVLFLIKLQNTYSTNTFLPLLVFLALAYFFRRNQKNVIRNKRTVVLACFFAVCYVVGKSYAAYGDDSLLTANPFQIFFACFSILGLTLLFWNALAFLQAKLDTCSFDGQESDSRIWKKCTLLILAGWLPFVIAYFPGSLPWDPMEQVRMYRKVDALNNHFPLLTTFLMGWSYDLGTKFGNFSIFGYQLLQVIVGAVAFGLVCRKLLAWRLPRNMVYLTAAFYALCPIWSTAEASTMKEYLYFPVFVLFLMVYIEIWEKRAKPVRKKMLLEYLLLALLLLLIRSEGIYIVLFSTLFLAVAMWKQKKKALGLMALCIILFLGNRAYTSALDHAGLISGYDKREAYSVVFQCTARYIREYETEVTEEERSVIDAVLNYEEIKTNYTPGNADPVKNTYRTPDEESWKSFQKTWLRMFFKHPKVYFDAAMALLQGYFLPGYHFPTKEVYYLYNRDHEGDLPVTYWFGDEVRACFESYVNLWKNGPVTSLLFNAGIYTWAMLWACWNLFRKGRFAVAVGLVPPLLVLGICCISPVTGLLRYAMPYIACVPLMIGYSIKEQVSPKMTEAESDSGGV